MNATYSFRPPLSTTPMDCSEVNCLGKASCHIREEGKTQGHLAGDRSMEHCGSS